jgi:hypothetical protein
MNTKVCSICNENKNIDEYNNSSKLVNGIRKYWKKNFCKKCQSEKFKKFSQSRNKDIKKENDKNYYEKNKDIIMEKKRNYYKIEKNRIRRNFRKQTYRKNRLKTDIKFRLLTTVRSRILASFKNKSNSSIEYLGCDIDFYKKWIEFTMKEDMTWENYGKIWNIDHVIPVSSFNSSNNDEMKKAFNWKNTRALYAKDNFSKGKNICEKTLKERDELLESFMEIYSNKNINYPTDNPQLSLLETTKKFRD